MTSDRSTMASYPFRHHDVAPKMCASSNFAALYDPHDVTSLFQTNIGNSVVAAPGDAVGLVLDKRFMEGQTAANYLQNSTNLLTNGNFDTDLDGWSNDGVATLTRTLDGQLAVDRSGGNVENGKRTATTLLSGLVVGETYYFVADIIEQSHTVQLCVWFDSSFTALVAQSPIYEFVPNQKPILFFTAEATSHVLALSVRGQTFATATFDNVCCVHVPGTHLEQETAAARPLWQSDGSLLFDGIDDRLVAGVTSISPTISAHVMVNTVDEQFVLLGDSSSNHAGVFSNVSSEASLVGTGYSTASVFINDQQPMGQADAQAKAATGMWERVTISGLDVSVMQTLSISADSASRFAGKIGRCILVDAAALPTIGNGAVGWCEEAY